MAQFQERITALKQENTRLRTELQVGERSLSSQAGVAELWAKVLDRTAGWLSS